jgi:hypothetical protein
LSSAVSQTGTLVAQKTSTSKITTGAVATTLTSVRDLKGPL